MGQILYICGGRSFRSQDPGRKIGGVVACWRGMGYAVTHLCGGDVPGAAAASGGYGAQKVYAPWYRHVGLLDPAVKSVSEYRDIRHDARMLRELDKTLAVARYDLVWERSSRLHSAGLAAARKAKVPYVLEWKDHLVDYPCSLFRRRALKTEARKNSEADFIVVESNVLREALSREGIAKEKILVAHNAVDPGEFHVNAQARKEMRESLSMHEDDTLVGYMGSYAFYHDAERLVRAACLLKDRGVKRIKFLMVGAGKEYPASRRVAEKAGILDTMLRMQPGVAPEKVPAVLSALDIAVLPGSTDIICPIKVQEYMSCGLPALVPDYPCNREVLTDGVTGMFFKPGDEGSLADQILFLSKDRELRTRLGEAARQEAMRRFTWENTWGRALEDILRRSGKEPAADRPDSGATI